MFVCDVRIGFLEVAEDKPGILPGPKYIREVGPQGLGSWWFKYNYNAAKKLGWKGGPFKGFRMLTQEDCVNVVAVR